MSTRTSRPGTRRLEGGSTLVEVLAGLMMLSVAALVVVQGVAISSSAVGRVEASVVALEAARAMADRIATTPIDEVYPTWGPDGTVGETFEVDGLSRGGEPAGRIRVVIDETSKDEELQQAFGLPRDLDGDGKAKTKDTRLSARALPVLVEVAWSKDADSRVVLPVVVVR